MQKKEKKQRKKHRYADRLRYMQMIEEGISINYISQHYGIDNTLLSTLYARYNKLGIEGIRKGKNFKASAALKKKIVLDIEKNHLSLCSASLKYGPSAIRISAWLRLYREHGLGSLDMVKRRGRPPGMGRPRKNSKPLTELERLQKENQELKTEIALIKKLQALVEEKKARLYKIGQGPSKD